MTRPPGAMPKRRGTHHRKRAPRPPATNHDQPQQAPLTDYDWGEKAPKKRPTRERKPPQSHSSRQSARAPTKPRSPSGDGRRPGPKEPRIAPLRRQGARRPERETGHASQPCAARPAGQRGGRQRATAQRQNGHPRPTQEESDPRERPRPTSAERKNREHNNTNGPRTKRQRKSHRRTERAARRAPLMGARDTAAG